MSSTNRRRFLCAALGAAGSLAVGAGTPARCGPLEPGSVGGRRAGLSDDLCAATRTSWALGSAVSITALHRRRVVVERAIDAAFDELERIESLLSIYRPDSQLSRLNRVGVLDDPHPYLVEVLRRAAAMSRRSGGAFDVTVQPLWDLYAEAKAGGDLPDDDAIRAARQRVDWRRVEIHRRQARLGNSGTAVTLNGIAQGFAADRVKAALKTHGIAHALVNTGEVASLGRKANREPWIVGIQHPRWPDAYVSLAALDGRCLATSGDYATSFSDDHRRHHIFDPKTGRSPKSLAGVSIVAGTGTEADALSTAVFVLGPAKGLDLVRRTPGADALLVLKDGRTLMTGGFPANT